MTEDQVRRIASEAASQAVLETLTRLGLDAGEPLEVQRDMQHLRTWRTSVEQVQSKGVLTIVGLAASGFIALLVVGVKEILHR